MIIFKFQIEISHKFLESYGSKQLSGQLAIFEPPVKYQSIEMPIFRQKLCNCKHLCKRQNLNVLNNQIINCHRVSAVFQHWSLRNFRFCKRPFALQGSYKSYLYLIKFQTIQINRSTKIFRNRRRNCESSWQSLNLGSTISSQKILRRLFRKTRRYPELYICYHQN